MIVVKLMGGIGNQMFQYAFGKSQAKKANTDLKYDIQMLLEKPTGFTPYDYELGIFKIPDSFSPKTPGVKVVYEVADGKYQEYLVENNVYYDGYWQSELYFDDILDELKNDFIFNTKRMGINTVAMGDNSVSIHARRGDYLNNNFVVDLSSTDYYKKAVDKIKETVKNPVFHIFSNNKIWAEEYFSFIEDEKYFEFNATNVDLYLMSLCKHNITANSTFSWWGAWLNNNPDKIVIAPEKWFNTIPTYKERQLRGSILI